MVARIPCEAKANSYSFAYLRTKKEKMGHALSLAQRDSTDQIKDLRAVSSHLHRERHVRIAWQRS